MTEWFLPIVHWLHIVTGVTWGGGLITYTLVIWPLLLTRPVGEARAFYEAFERRAIPVLGPAGGLAVLLGILRATWLGPVQSLESWWGTSYGWWLTLAVATFVFIGLFDGLVARRVTRRLLQGETWSPGARRAIWRLNGAFLAGIAVLLTCMVAMRLGW